MRAVKIFLAATMLLSSVSYANDKNPKPETKKAGIAYVCHDNEGDSVLSLVVTGSVDQKLYLERVKYLRNVSFDECLRLAKTANASLDGH